MRDPSVDVFYSSTVFCAISTFMDEEERAIREPRRSAQVMCATVSANLHFATVPQTAEVMMRAFLILPSGVSQCPIRAQT